MWTYTPKEKYLNLGKLKEQLIQSSFKIDLSYSSQVTILILNQKSKCQAHYKPQNVKDTDRAANRASTLSGENTDGRQGKPLVKAIRSDYTEYNQKLIKYIHVGRGLFSLVW